MGLLEDTVETKPPVKKSKRKYTDEQAFLLWQSGMSDSEIGAAFEVSRQAIQRWRDFMELPSTIKENINTHDYRLVSTEAGYFVIYEGEDGRMEGLR